ncbi:acetolactate synthase 2 small subunit [Aliikangiella marina]|uniref:Acetolactate synthase 2 small subunit n=1 Tax=Aliikangiella marina TaxID=1712262 RepID=A0A545T9R6_9GAMM|nr:acetolactate synthase 2 small subunit [Aliikangiella marina]TQV73963.1 acetolactate synthase 2 small subunit [Aliikangiella marina]
MKQHHLKIKASNHPTLLEQLLRVVRFRGFNVDHIAMNVLPQEQMVDISVNVKSQRPIHLLESQLKKLVTVDQVYVEENYAAQASF